MSDTEATQVTIPGHISGMGRPTKYKPEYCDRVVEWGMQGKSKAWICAELEIADNTMRTWCETYPDFLQAMDISQKKSQQWWEDAGQNGMITKSIDGSIYSRSMSARFPKDWRENSTTTIQNPDGSNLMDPLAAVLLEVNGKTRTI